MLDRLKHDTKIILETLVALIQLRQKVKAEIKIRKLKNGIRCSIIAPLPAVCFAVFGELLGIMLYEGIDLGPITKKLEGLVIALSFIPKGGGENSKE